MNIPYDFYPRPPRGGRPTQETERILAAVFLSTPSARRATKRSCASLLLFLFLSTPSARRATLLRLSFADCGTISIHALREEGDARMLAIGGRIAYFYPRPPRGGRPAEVAAPRGPRKISIHALREEGDCLALMQASGDKKFLSTPSARRATGRDASGGLCGSHFYPRPPRGGRQQKQRQNLYFQTNYTTFCTNLEEP